MSFHTDIQMPTLWVDWLHLHTGNAGAMLYEMRLLGKRCIA